MVRLARTWSVMVAAAAAIMAVPGCSSPPGGQVLDRYHRQVNVAGRPAGAGTPIYADQHVTTSASGELQFRIGQELTCDQYNGTDVIVEPSSGGLLEYVSSSTNDSTVTCATLGGGRKYVRAGHVRITMADPVFTVVRFNREVTIRVAAGSLTVTSTDAPGHPVTLHAGQQVIILDGQPPGEPTYFDLAQLSAFERQAIHYLNSSDVESHLSATAAAVTSTQSFTCGGTRPSISLTGSISSDQPTTLTYQWYRSDGTLSALYSMHFTRAGAQDARPDSWTPPADQYNGTDTLSVSGVSGATASSEPVPVTLTCTQPVAITSIKLTGFSSVPGTVSATWHVTTDSTAAFTFTAEFALASDVTQDITKDDFYHKISPMTESGQTTYDITVPWQYSLCTTSPLVVTRGTAIGTDQSMTASGETATTKSCPA